MLSLADLRGEQKAPWASVSQGAAGNAYALWYVGTRRRDPAAVAAGRRWWKYAARAAKLRSGFYTREFRGTPTSGSVALGRPGLDLVDGLIAHAQDDKKATTRAFARLATTLGRTRPGPGQVEVFAGRAGGLVAALHAHRVTGEPQMRALADQLAARLLAEPPIEMAGFAHGRPGVHHSLLAWSAQTKTALPAAFLAALAAPTDDAIVARSPRLAGTFCNGLPGFVMLWVKAFEVTGDARWRDRAVTALRSVLAHYLLGAGSLCCGAGGVAYAALAVARIDDSEDWRARAVGLCAAGIATVPAHGLFKGLAGLACLAVDLVTPGEARYPLMEP